MGKKGSAPKPPDPKETSAAQTGTSIATSLANTMQGNVSRIGPEGSLTYDQTGSYDFTDPFTNQRYQLPTWTATEKLSPAQQRTYDQNQGAEYGMARVANQSARRLGDILGQDFRLSSLPDAGKVPTDIPGPEDFSKDRLRVEQALMRRMQPQIDRDREAMQSSLANQGIGLGARAYSAAQDDFGRNVNDARLGAIGAGGAEQSRMFGMGMDQFNAGMGQFNAQNALRQQAMQQGFAERNQPINEITALLSGSQVSMPNFAVNQPSPIPTTDNAGLINANYGQEMQAYQQKQQQAGQLWGGLFGLGAGALTGAGAAGGFGKLFGRGG